MFIHSPNSACNAWPFSLTQKPEMLARMKRGGKRRSGRNTKSNAAIYPDQPTGGAACHHHHPLSPVWEKGCMVGRFVSSTERFSAWKKLTVYWNLMTIRHPNWPPSRWSWSSDSRRVRVWGWISEAPTASGGTIDPFGYITSIRKTWQADWMRRANRKHMPGTLLQP